MTTFEMTRIWVSHRVGGFRVGVSENVRRRPPRKPGGGSNIPAWFWLLLIGLFILGYIKQGHL